MSLVSVLIASLLGSLHCAGMCGGFALFCGGQNGNSLKVSGPYNIGRLITYLILGALAGKLGSALDDVSTMVGIGRVAAVILGIFLIVWGIVRLIPSLRFKSAAVHIEIGEYRGSWYEKLLSKANFFPVPVRSFVVGMASTLLPCGWLYSFVAVAGARANPMDGMAVMAFFWLGTLPVMASIGGITKVISARWGAQLPYVTSALLIFAGLFSIFSHLSIVNNDGSMECHH